MKKVLCTLIILSFVFNQFCINVAPLAAQERKKIAVFPFEDTNKEAKDVGYGSALSNMMLTAFISGGKFDVIERAQIKKVTEELSLGISGAVDQSTAKQLGKLLGVDFMIFGSVSKFGDLVEVDLRMVSPETGMAIKAVSESSRGQESIRLMVNRLTRQLEGEKVPPKPKTDKQIVQKAVEQKTVPKKKKKSKLWLWILIGVAVAGGAAAAAAAGGGEEKSGPDTGSITVTW